VIAHRGATLRHPQNTCAAVADAVALGADGIEFDLQVCKSGEVVVFHDFDLKAFGRPEARVVGLDLAELRRIDLGGGARVPTLDELLDAAGDRLVLHLELKHHDLRDVGLEASVARVLLRRRADERARMWVSSFNPVSLWRIGRRLPELPLGFLFHGEQSAAWRASWPLVLARATRGLAALHAQHKLVTPAFMAYARARGLRVHTWTVDRRAVIERVAALGVDAIITNQPLRVREVLSAAAGSRDV